MRIGLVTMHFPPTVRGGAHLSAFYLAKGLAAAGHEVHVFTTPSKAANGDWTHPELHRHAAFELAKPKTSWDLDIAAIRMGLSLRKHLGELGLQFHVLHAYGMDTIPAVVMSRRYGRPVATANGYWATCPYWDHTHPATKRMNELCDYRHIGECVRLRRQGRSKLRQFALRHMMLLSMAFRKSFARRLELILPISQSVKSLYERNGFSPVKMQVCYNMLDTSEYSTLSRTYLHERFGIAGDRRILLFAGRFAPYKGLGEIIDAIPHILAHDKDVQFLFVGQGSLLTSLKSQITATALDDHVTFGGFMPPQEMPHVYCSAYLYLHSATWPEPFARGVIEALAAGTAVIATNTGGTPEVITHDVTGILIPPFDSRALAAASIRLLGDERLRDRLAGQGRELVHHRFSINGQIGAYLSAYKRL